MLPYLAWLARPNYRFARDPSLGCRGMNKVLLLVASASLVSAAAFFFFAVTPKPPGHGPVISVGEVPDVQQRPCDERRVVETPDQLEQVLRFSDFVGCVVVAKDKFLDMTGRLSIPIKSGVWVQGERGELGSRPSLFTDAKCADPSASPPSPRPAKVFTLSDHRQQHLRQRPASARPRNGQP